MRMTPLDYLLQPRKSAEHSKRRQNLRCTTLKAVLRCFVVLKHFPRCVWWIKHVLVRRKYRGFGKFFTREMLLVFPRLSSGRYILFPIGLPGISRLPIIREELVHHSSGKLFEKQKNRWSSFIGDITLENKSHLEAFVLSTSFLTLQYFCKIFQHGFVILSWISVIHEP